MNKVYALITRKCNLTCPYCDAKDQEDNFDRDKFIQALEEFDGNITLFGGEPTLFRNRLKEILCNPYISNKVTSITTNLMIIDDEIIELLKRCGSIGTSWNPSRFRGNEYDIWCNHLHALSGHIQLRVLITMTFELLNMNPSDVADVISTWDKSVVRDFMFEDLVDDKCDPQYFERVDDWLCEFYDICIERSDIPPFIVNMGDDLIRCFDCSNTYTLEPTGTLRHGCHHAQSIHVPDECYSCELSSECMPCRLQKYCSFPKKLHQKLLDLKRKNDGED